ncbi:hypothetical protein OROMI_027281 [Orobanche minor]
MGRLPVLTVFLSDSTGSLSVPVVRLLTSTLLELHRTHSDGDAARNSVSRPFGLILLWRLMLVCECLLRGGSQSLAQITESTELTRESVINGLRVLIHQNCVQAFSTQRDGSFGEEPKRVTQYIALFDNVIHKLRAPKFMQIVSEELGDDCLEIFQGLIQHGRLSFQQIIERRQETTGSPDIHILRENFSRLLDARYIERCPIPNPFLEPLSEEEIRAIKRGVKSAKGEEIKGSLQDCISTEERALEASLEESMRFLMVMDDVTEKNDEEGSKSVILPMKRKQDVLDPDKMKEVLWRVNFEEFVLRLRNKACISYVKTRINDEAGMVLSAMLELSRLSGSRQKIEKTVLLPSALISYIYYKIFGAFYQPTHAYLSLNAIYDEVIKKEGGVGMDFERTRVSLHQLECETLKGVDENYSIDIKSIIEQAQNEEVEAVVLKRYGGVSAYRIFRLLSRDRRFLETDKITATVFVDKKETVKILYKLWKDEFVHMEKVASSGATKQSYFLLWRCNKQTVWKQVLDEMYHAALNLRLRIAHEIEQGKEVLQLPREKLVGELARKYKLMARVKTILESSLMNLDDAIMLFHHF